MPDYKRKKVKKSIIRKKSNQSDKIVMKPKKNITSNVIPQENIKVIRGTNFKRIIKLKFLLSFSAIICILLVFLSLILPVGIYENIVNAAALVGHGNFPADIPGNTIINCYSTGSYYYILTDTSISAYSNNGKYIFTDLHGFSNPIISVSDTRVLVYDQGGKNINIYNLGGKIYTTETENDIITAGISRNGTYAVSTHSDNFNSVVNVYNKNNKIIYTWNSAKDIINNVLINPNGNKLAVTTLNAISGQYVSKMHIFNFDSADPLYTCDLESSIGLSLMNIGKGIALISNDKFKFVNWSKFSTTDISASGEINMIRKSSNGILLVFNRANDRSDNTVVLVSNSGKKLKEFKIDTIITDIQYSKGRIYYLSDVNIKILDNDGNILRSGVCNYGTERFVVIAPNTIAAINDNKLVKIDIQKG